MTDTTYNGWTNRETWLVNLWLTNDAHDVDLCEAVRLCKTTRDGAEELEGYVDNLMDTHAMPTQGLFHDLLQAALAGVNWYEIAKNWREEE